MRVSFESHIIQKILPRKMETSDTIEDQLPWIQKEWNTRENYNFLR